MIIGARVIVVGKTYGPLSSGESQAEAWSESPGLERRAGVQLESPSCQCCLLTLLNRQDVPERILYASVDLRPLDRPRKERQSAHAGDVREATDIWLDELDVPEKGSYVVGARARSWHLVCLLDGLADASHYRKSGAPA
eukprot:tig00001029_g6441.t1